LGGFDSVSDDSHVTYSVKEILAVIRQENIDWFKRLDEKMDNMAQATDARFASLETRIRLLEAWKTKALAVGAAILAAVGVATPFITHYF
jgi:hypothetical protein